MGYELCQKLKYKISNLNRVTIPLLGGVRGGLMYNLLELSLQLLLTSTLSLFTLHFYSTLYLNYPPFFKSSKTGVFYNKDTPGIYLYKN